MSDLPRDPNAAPIFDANGEPWAPPDPSALDRLFAADRTEALERAITRAAGLLPSQLFWPNCRCVLVAPAPAPVKAKTFDEWLADTAALLEECEKRGQ